MNSEQQLIQGCIEGKALSQREFYDRFARKMMGVCLRYAKDRMEAEDILQEGFIKIFRNIESYKFTGSLEGWVRRIMVNTALEHYRKNKHIIEFHEVLDSKQEDENNNIISSINALELLKIIQKLPAGYRMIFNLYAIEGYKHEEIADKLNISVSTSKSQYMRAKLQLQKLIELELA